MRRIIALSSLSLIFILFSCFPYRKITFSKAEAYQKKRVAENIDRYDVIVHGKDSNFILKNPSVENNGLKGKLEYLPNEDTPWMVEDKKQKVPVEEQNDLHVFVNRQTKLSEGDSVRIEDATVERTEMYAKNKQGMVGVAWTLFLIIGGVFIVLILIIILALIAAINDSSGSSGSNSSGSNSSGSNSSGSNSGGSDSGGSDSGCYVATMAYGSYDAPQVLILRQFRDRFLQKFSAGRAFIRWYYAKSPQFVAKHRSKKWLHKSLRVFLNIFVTLLKPIFSK